MARARPVVHCWIAQNAGGVTPVVKTHNANIDVNGVPTITPEFTRSAIYIVRHPFDVAVSVKGHFGARDYDHAIEQMTYRNYVQSKDDRFVDAPVGSWSQNVRSWTEVPNRKINVFRYEDLVSDPAKSFTQIGALLGVRDQKAVDRAIADVEIEALKSAERTHGFTETSSHTGRFFARGTAGCGETLLSDGQKRTLSEKVSQAAQLHGYDL